MPIVAPTPVAPLPIPATTMDPANFDARIDAFNSALQGAFQPTMNALATVTHGNAVQAHADAQVAADAAAAANSAAQMAVNAPGISGTSVTSLILGVGDKALVTQPGKAWAIGQSVVVARTADAASAKMAGIVTAYNAGTGALTVNVSQFVGAGTYTGWTISAGTVHGLQGDVQISPTDTTPGRLMRVGAFGLGDIAVNRTGESFNTVPAYSHFWMGSGLAYCPFDIAGWWMVQQLAHNADHIVQTATQFSGAALGRTFTRIKATTWGAWTEVATSANANTFAQVNNFQSGARLGSTSPVIRTLKLSGTMPSAALSFVAIPHGLGTGALDIISVNARISYDVSGSPYNWAAPGLRAFQLGYGLTWNQTSVNVATLETGQSEKVYGRAVDVLVTFAT